MVDAGNAVVDIVVIVVIVEVIVEEGGEGDEEEVMDKDMTIEIEIEIGMEEIIGLVKTKMVIWLWMVIVMDLIHKVEGAEESVHQTSALKEQIQAGGKLLCLMVENIIGNG